MSPYRTLLLLTILYQTSEYFAKELYDFRVTRVACIETDPQVTYNVTCFTRQLSRTSKGINILIYFAPNVTIDDIWVKINYYQRLNNAYKRSFIDAEENFCGFIAGTAKSNLIKILWPYLKKSSDIVGCPIKSSHNVSNLVFGDKFLPPMLPEGQARLDIHVRNGPKRLSLVKVQFFLEIKPKGAVKLEF